MKLEILNPGQQVKFVNNLGPKATILAADIRGSSDNLLVRYECSWWEGDCRSTAWFSPSEIYVDSNTETSLDLGFVKKVIPKKFYNLNTKEYPVTAKTVGELKKVLQELPDDLQLFEEYLGYTVDVFNIDSLPVLIFQEIEDSEPDETN